LFGAAGRPSRGLVTVQGTGGGRLGRPAGGLPEV